MGKPYIAERGGHSANYRYAEKTITQSDGSRYPTDILKFNYGSNTFHPTQKPVDLVCYLVRTYSDKGDLILDNCMGSGTTAVACIREGRNFIGFELNKEYYNKAVERINAEQLEKDTNLCLFETD